MSAMSFPLAELIFPGAQHAENFRGMLKYLPCMRLSRSAHHRHVATQKGIHAYLQTQGGWQARIAVCAQAIDARLVFERRAIDWLHGEGKAQIGGGIFVAAKNLSLGRQLPQAVQRSIHLLWRTLEHATTTRAEKRISAKKRAMAPKCDVTHGMPRHLQNLEAKSQVRQFAALGIADGAGSMRDALIIGTDHRHLSQVQQFRYAPDMIRVMVSQ